MGWELPGIGSRVGRRIVTLFVGCSLIPLATLAILSLTQVSAELKEQSDRQLHQASKSTGMTLLERLLILESDLQFVMAIVRQSGLASLDDAPEDLRARLRRHFGAISLVTKTNTASLWGTFSRPPVLNETQLAHLASGRTLTLTVELPQPHVLMAVAFDPRAPGERLIYGAPSASELWGIDGVLHAGSELFVLDDAHRVLCNTHPGKPPVAEFAAIASHSPASGRFEWASSDEDYVAGYWRLYVRSHFMANWVIVNSRARSQVFSTLTSFQRFFLMTTFLSFLIVVILSLTLIRRTLNPIAELKTATERVARGDLSCSVAISSRDEFEDLGRSFNHMVGELLENTQRREQTEQELVKARDEAVAAAETEARFVTNISHELRTPLTSIKSFTELLREFDDDEDPKTRDEFLAIIADQTERLTRLVDDVLQVGELQSGAIAWDFGPVDLTLSLDEVLTQLPKATRNRVEVDVPADFPRLEGDRRYLSRVWNHLIDNALKFSHHDKTVTVTASVAAEQGIIEVADQGVGIHRSDQERIFERFHQVDEDILTDKPCGTGLGLALARDIVAQHGGRLTVDSEPGRGSTFRVCLPLHRDPSGVPRKTTRKRKARRA